jgi:hypothetical protein
MHNQTYTAKQFLKAYENKSDKDFLIIEKDSKRSNGFSSVSYCNLKFLNIDDKYVPLNLVFKNVKISGIKTGKNFDSAYINFRDSTVQDNGQNVGMALQIISDEFNLVAAKTFPNKEICQFRQTKDKAGTTLDDSIYRVKLRTNQSGVLTATFCEFVENNTVPREFFTNTELRKEIQPGSRIWVSLNFSYCIQSSYGISSACSVRQLLYEKSTETMDISNLMDNDDE